MSLMRHDITLRQIDGFLKAAELLSFTRAAESMHITQSAFSQLIRELEAGLSVRLFDRTTRRIVLTEAGALLQRKMTRGVMEIEDACREARAIARVEHGQITVGSLASLAVGVVMHSLGALRREHPGIKVALREDHNGALLHRVAQGEVDFAVCARSADAADLHFDALFDDELVAVLRWDDPLAQRRRLSWLMLATAPLVMTVHQSSTRHQVVRALAAHGVTRDIDYDVGNMFTALAMVREGFGVTFIPALTMAHSNMSGLVWRRIRSPTPSRPIAICRRADRSLSPAAQKFEQLLRQHVSQFEPLAELK